MIRRTILLTLTAAVCASAQTAAERLASTEPSQLAWGAYLAAESQQKDLIPAILPLLKLENSGVRLAAIDALIRLDADVPQEDLAPLLIDPRSDYWLDSVLILLAKAPDKHRDLLLALFDRAMDDTQWDVLNDILLAARPPGYAQRLLKGSELRFAVCVDGSTCPTERDRVMDGCGISTIILPPIEVASFPSRFAYVLGAWSTMHNATVTTSVENPRRIQYTRLAYNDSYFLWHGCAQRPEHDPLPYLALLAGIDPQAADAQPFDWGRIFHWSTPAQFQADAEIFLSTLRGRIERLRGALVKQRALTAEEALSGPTLRVEVRDERRNKSEPLPPIDWKLDR